MEKSFCCEEMEYFFGSVSSNVDEMEDKGIAIFTSDDSPDELALDASISLVNQVPNIIFRYCPYCGKGINPEQPALSKDEFQGKARSLLFSEDLAEPMPEPRRIIFLEDVVNQLKTLVNESRI